ncbi:Nitrate/nitrite transporter [Pseudomonas sp. SHC52]|nr:Nitrate/nitrite transporter [Pseudomonas sp. SHC52]
MITAVAETLTGNINNGTYVLALCLLVSGGLILAIPASMLARTPKAAVTSAKLEVA